MIQISCHFGVKLSKGIEIRITKHICILSVNCGTIHNTKDSENNPNVCIKENRFLKCGIQRESTIFKKKKKTKESLTFTYSMDEFQECYAKRNKPDTERQTLHDLLMCGICKIVKLIEADNRMMGIKEMQMLVKGYKFQLARGISDVLYSILF